MNLFYIETYGCQMNKADSAEVIADLLGKGFKQTEDINEAHFILVNTCSVRKTAENRIYGRLGYFSSIKKKNGSVVLVMGCMSERLGHDFIKENETVDIVVGTYYKNKIGLIISSYVKGEKLVYVGQEEGLSFTPAVPDMHFPARAFVTISHGCNNYCSYCIVPYLRGPEVSRPSGEIIADVTNLVKKGVKQVTLLGQNVNSYGKDSGDISFAALLRELAHSTDITWIKFVSSHPRDFTPDIIEVMKDEKKVCNWLHLALQSGSNRILSLMNRHYTIEDFTKKIRLLREQVPGCAVTTDIMVGFPGETEEDFRDTLRAVRDIGFDDAYMYRYNVREGTAAAREEDSVPDKVKAQRLTELIAVQKEEGLRLRKKRIGTECEVLVERISKKDRDEVMGISAEEIMVAFPGDESLKGRIVKVKIIDIHGTTLRGELI